MELTERAGRIEDQLEQLTAAQTRTEEQLGRLAAAQTRTEEQLGRLAAAQTRTEEQVGRLAAAQTRTEEQVGELTAAQTRTEAQLAGLRAWQLGESGRRNGEQYERSAARSAWRLLGAGEGGSPEGDPVRRRLTATLNALPVEARNRLSALADPFLADVIWWKRGAVAVVEVSLAVDDHDVERAHARAQTLASAGVNAVPMVIGDSWADDEVRAGADKLRFAWHVGGEVNDRFIAFRALPPEDAPL